MDTKSTVGVIGIGAMGMAIAANLHERGFAVRVRDVRPEAEREAAEQGMIVADCPASLVANAELVIIVVVDAKQIDDVLFGDNGVACEAARGKAVMLCSTIAPEDTERFVSRLAALDISAIDAPISGGPARARNGTMSMMLAAPDALLARYDEVLAAMSDRRFRIGEKAGDGARAKLVNNLLAGINLVAGAEAMALAARIGLDQRKMFDVICASSGASWIFQDRMARVLDDDFAPRAFAHILTKDITLATAMADGQGCETPLGDAALAVFRETLARGMSQLDDAAVIKTYLEKK